MIVTVVDMSMKMTTEKGELKMTIKDKLTLLREIEARNQARWNEKAVKNG